MYKRQVGATENLILAACLAKGTTTIKNCAIEPEIKDLTNFLKTAGAKIKTTNNTIQIKGPKKIRSLDYLKTGEYPNFPTDLQAQIMVLLTRANGTSTIEENIFENRFMHVSELKRLGAKINIKGNRAIIEGTNNLEGAELMSSDLRASVALVLAAFISRGTSIINLSLIHI